ncbi:thermonuclease family protein [Bradyrhizobium sp. JR3.5]
MPSPRTKPLNDPRHTATHEAGHAVIGRVLTLLCGGAIIAADHEAGEAGHAITEDSELQESMMLKKLWTVAALLIFGLTNHLNAEPITSDKIRVLDGDTIRVFNKRPDVRLVGFNAPETRRAQCDAERELGDKATRRVRDLVRDESLDFTAVPCSCKAGTEGKWFCNHGRSCRTLKAGGRDVGVILIEEGLAVPFKCYATSCPKTPKPWCRSSRKS